jgi:hypothetical protein
LVVGSGLRAGDSVFQQSPARRVLESFIFTPPPGKGTGELLEPKDFVFVDPRLKDGLTARDEVVYITEVLIYVDEIAEHTTDRVMFGGRPVLSNPVGDEMGYQDRR